MNTHAVKPSLPIAYSEKDETGEADSKAEVIRCNGVHIPNCSSHRAIVSVARPGSVSLHDSGRFQQGHLIGDTPAAFVTIQNRHQEFWRKPDRKSVV